MRKKYLCTLSKEIKDCNFRDKDGACSMDRKGCGFRELKVDISKPSKPQKWFEKYISKY